MKTIKDFKFVKYEKNDVSIDVRYDEDGNTIWLTQSEITQVLSLSKQNVNNHIRSIIKSNDESLVVNWWFTTEIEGKDKKIYHSNVYNLNMIEAILKRSKSTSGYEFVKWANKLINSYNDNKIEPSIANNYEIVTFENDEVMLDIRVSPTEDTVWLTQSEIALLFATSKKNISSHIKNIYDENELEKCSTIQESWTVQIEGNRKINRKINYYNLDMILSIGYRVNSKKGIEFRRWASKVLKQYLIKGYALNNHRLNNRLESYDYLINDLNETKSMLIKLANNDESKSKTIESIINRLDKLEDKENIFVGQILYENDFFEGYSFTKKKLNEAKSSIILIDDYVDISVLDMFNGIDKNIDILIYTLPSAKLSKQDILHFESTYKSKIIKTNKAHFRILIIDEEIYVYTYSIKDLGKKRSAIIRIDFIDKNTLISGL